MAALGLSLGVPFARSGGAPALTYATWNPSDTGAGIVLSNGDLTATFGGGWSSGRATIGKTTGKWFWEISCDTATTHAPGISTASASLSSYVGGDASGWSYYSLNGNKTNSGSGTAYGSAFTAGDVIGVALNMDASELTFYLNGVSQGVIPIALAGAVFPAFSSFGNSLTANFGASAFVHSVPVGYNSGIFI